jgi:hypothetical protein
MIGGYHHSEPLRPDVTNPRVIRDSPMQIVQIGDWVKELKLDGGSADPQSMGPADTDDCWQSQL